MMKRKPPGTKLSSFVFQVDIMIEDRHHAQALEKLIAGLNGAEFDDYRITSGIRLGELIDERTIEGAVPEPIPIVPQQAKSETSAKADSVPSDGFAPIRAFMKSNKLIRLIVNRGLGIKLSIPCRIINMDEGEHLITVYHVDEKQVYTFRLNEIEDFIE
ncbi:hypothetical protein [Paenibacillus sp. PAMC21692]|uniref:hypothetical protein n=1 Tax=Paenibacillus sp. PAMC21692 TaxID=2762320 RepID=UPI00164E697D|nr:hypothetical protein [Paenibacillus sp. PAMC21692]QNK56051.1 hypothetical protein H7F31_26275 [Paenibacillus sp. PAMC21692]